MNGALALAIALAAHGNPYLASPGGSAPPELGGTNSTLRYVVSIDFCRHGALWAVRGTSGWYRALREMGASRLSFAKLPYDLDLPEVFAIAFAGAVNWGIMAEGPKSSLVWSPTWKHTGGRAKPWTVHVWESPLLRAPEPPRSGLGPTRDALREALNRALDFSNRAGLDFFPEEFTQALGLLDSPSPAIPYHPDMLPWTGYSLLARQITAAAAKGFVFGGMGSFSDLGFDSPALNEEYRTLLAALYETVVRSLLVAANSFEPR